MRAGIILVTVIGFVSALPLASEHNVKLEQIKESLLTAAVGERVGPIESIILEVLELIRGLLPDPLAIDEIHLDDQILPLPGAFLKINDLTIRDMSTFRVDELQLTMISLFPQRQRMNFNFVIPAVNVDAGSYDLFLGIFGGQVYGTGDMRLRIVNPRVKGELILTLRITLTGIFLNIDSCQISIGLDSFEPTITGMFNNEASSELVSRFLANLVPEVLDFFEEDITNILSTAVMTIGNLILADLDIGGLLPFLPATP